MTNKIKTSSLDYPLSNINIKQVPYSNRANAKLLDVHSKRIIKFKEIQTFIPSNSTLVINTSTVHKVRIKAKKKHTKGNVELFILKILDMNTFECLIKTNSKKTNDKVYYVDNIEMCIVSRTGDVFTIKITNSECDTLISHHGLMPLPPYIKDNESKYNGYQTEYADGGFSVAAPTAGLHFTKTLINKLKHNGVNIINLNLDVGLGTFSPIKSRYINDHKIHTEEYEINKNAIEQLLDDKRSNRKIICVGTSSLRAIETCFKTDIPQLQGVTKLFIKRGFSFKFANGLITNFHAPRSSLLAIIDSLLEDDWINIYNYALNSGLYFLSFGDAMYIDIDKCKI